jgi:HPt (histidine-containing phosphotransfer) domain-containing protein/CheY-like chemotaxis protein
MGQDSKRGSGVLQRILVIDASPTVSMMICGLLRRWGYLADTGMTEADYDLVIADPALADSRVAALRRRDVPWLALLSAGHTRDAADAVFWVHKPIQSSELQDAVARCLEAPPATPADGIDVTAIAELWGSVENPGFRQVAKAFLTELATCLAMIGKALDAEDRRRLAREAHSVVGAAANVGVPQISRAAHAVEDAAPHAGPERLRALIDQLAAASRRDVPVLRALIEE